MKDMCAICAEWASMLVICLACGALVYQEHVHSCPQQIPSATHIKYYLSNRMRKCCTIPLISNWPFLIILIISYATTIFYFQNPLVAFGGFFATIVLYQVIGFCLRKSCQAFKQQKQAQICNYKNRPTKIPHMWDDHRGLYYDGLHF